MDHTTQAFIEEMGCWGSTFKELYRGSFADKNVNKWKRKHFLKGMAAFYISHKWAISLVLSFSAVFNWTWKRKKPMAVLLNNSHKKVYLPCLLMQQHQQTVPVWTAVSLGKWEKNKVQISRKQFWRRREFAEQNLQSIKSFVFKEINWQDIVWPQGQRSLSITHWFRGNNMKCWIWTSRGNCCRRETAARRTNILPQLPGGLTQ